MHMSAGRPVVGRNILKGLHPLDLRSIAQNCEVTTAFQAAAYVHRRRSRDAAAVRVSDAGQWTPTDQATVEHVHQLMRTQRLVQVDLQVCAAEPDYHVRLYLPLSHADLAFMASRAFLPAATEWVKRSGCDATVIVQPQWSEVRSVLVDMQHLTCYILGSDYYGDIHNSILRLVGHRSRQHGQLAVHAASLEIHARSRKTGMLNTCGLLIIGVGGAGKTTLATCDYELDTAAREKATVRQDDRVILHMDGRIQGTEGQGLYVRTFGLNPQDRPALWAAVNHEDAILENVWINTDGSVDYANQTLTANGRAIAPLRQIPGFDGQIDVARCTHVLFLVKEGERSAASLDHQQAVQLYARAEMMEAGRQDVEQVENAKVFAEFLRRNAHVQCFAVNTGTIREGQTTRAVTAAESAQAICEICREGLAG